jgi:hypothetical protein
LPKMYSPAAVASVYGFQIVRSRSSVVPRQMAREWGGAEGALWTVTIWITSSQFMLYTTWKWRHTRTEWSLMRCHVIHDPFGVLVFASFAFWHGISRILYRYLYLSDRFPLCFE